MSADNIDTQLERAVYHGNLEEVKSLLSAGANLHLRESWNKDTLLHCAKSAEIAKELLLRGAAVDATNSYRETPLDYAASYSKPLEFVSVLLKHGANVNATNRKGNTPLNIAVKRSPPDLEVIKELLKCGADINIRNREKKYSNTNYTTPLDNAVSYLPCAQLLIKFALINNFREDYKKIINLDPYTKWSNYSKLSSYLEDCVCEILQMKTDVIQKGDTLYECLAYNCNNRLPSNNTLCVRLAKMDFSVNYPIYNCIILDKIKPFLKRADLLNKLSDMHICTLNEDVKGQTIMLDHDSTRNITEYLSNFDLLNLIAAFDDLNKCAIQTSSSLDNLQEPDTRLYETSTNNDAKRARIQ